MLDLERPDVPCSATLTLEREVVLAWRSARPSNSNTITLVRDMTLIDVLRHGSVS